MLVVAFVSFSLFNFVGDPINNMVGEETSDEERAELRETLGLMDPIHIQFSRFVVNAAKGEFGISYHSTNLSCLYQYKLLGMFQILKQLKLK